MSRFLFPFCMVLSAMLLFGIQPMVARALLPVYGGTPAVWTLCMLFFQVILLGAYGYVAVLSWIKKSGIWRVLHSVLLILSLGMIPLSFHPLATQGLPEWNIIYTLLSQSGLPLFMIATSAPLVQFSFSQTKAKGATDPYFLYIASNLGSLASLVLYPVVFERFVGLKNQFYWWSIGYVIYVLCLIFVLCVNRFNSLIAPPREKIVWPWRTMLSWTGLSFVPCSFMLGVTLYISTDIAATPLFWALPLALYLLTFIFAFIDKPILPYTWLARNSLFFLVFVILGFILNGSQINIWQSILFNLLTFFVLALLAHRQLFLIRPKPHLLTLFYLCLAFGGVLAGVFNGILAPHWFNQVYEYPLVLLLSLLILPGKTMGWSESVRRIALPLITLCLLLSQYYLPEIHWFSSFTTFQISAVLALIVLVVFQQSKFSLVASLFILFAFIFLPALQQDEILVQERNFYGIKKVVNRGTTHALISQSTVHGLQFMGDAQPSGFHSYYGAIKPVLDLMKHEWHSLPVTLIGLGIGTVACQLRQEDQLKIIELDDQVIQLAKTSQLFTYLRDCPPHIDLIQQDGRLAIQELPTALQKLIIIDAFSSDAIPIHLLTLEAFTLYKQKITQDGFILINLSNRHLHLLPVVTAAGRTLDLMVFFLADKGNASLGQFSSEWALLTQNEALAFKLMGSTNWRFGADTQQFLWTDDYSNIIPLLKW